MQKYKTLMYFIVFSIPFILESKIKPQKNSCWNKNNIVSHTINNVIQNLTISNLNPLPNISITYSFKSINSTHTIIYIFIIILVLIKSKYYLNKKIYGTEYGFRIVYCWCRGGRYMRKGEVWRMRVGWVFGWWQRRYLLDWGEVMGFGGLKLDVSMF